MSLAGDFEAAIAAYRSSGNKAELLAAAAILKQAGSWKDPRASAAWEKAAAVVVEASRTGRPGWATEAGRCSHLAADLLTGPQMRVRGIQPERIIEGLVSPRLE